MTIAEKHYRITYRIKPEEKLTNEQWKIVNMMHRCLKENNTPKLPHGTILVNKQQLIEHIKTIKVCLNATDKLMGDSNYKEFSKGEGGSKLAKIWNALNFTMQSIEHFQLHIPFKKIK